MLSAPEHPAVNGQNPDQNQTDSGQPINDSKKKFWNHLKKSLDKIGWIPRIVIVLVVIFLVALLVPWKPAPSPEPQLIVVRVIDINSNNPLANAYLYDEKGQLLGRSQNTGEIQLPPTISLKQKFRVEKENYLPLQTHLGPDACFKLSRITANLRYTSFKPFSIVFQSEGFNKIISDDASSGEVKIPINSWVTVVIKIGTPDQWQRANIFLNSPQDNVIVNITEHREQRDGKPVTIIRSQWLVNGKSPNTQILLPYGGGVTETEFFQTN